MSPERKIEDDYDYYQSQFEYNNPPNIYDNNEASDYDNEI